MSESKQRGDAVAVVGDTYQLFWVGTGPILAIMEKHGIKVGDRLYHGPAAEAAPELVEALQTLVKRIEFYSSLKDDERPNIEQWEYTEGSSDMAKARAALAKATG
ncbi:hypothetical protein [Burkholderia glumae]|uniref:hypothetical protein n=1 Tax=Burkholderia glumae TaxID=337 RepID=UPI002150D501|nr:hypothetical protein [Burkholderia glumae]UVS93508.1 hypothetical protein EFP17_28455 [Burkholderia glumae]